MVPPPKHVFFGVEPAQLRRTQLRNYSKSSWNALSSGSSVTGKGETGYFEPFFALMAYRFGLYPDFSDSFSETV
jgi:hypothetical protein